MTTNPLKITPAIAQNFLKQDRAAFAMIHDVYNFLQPLATQNNILEQIEGIFLLDNACQELLDVRLSLFLNSAHKTRFLLAPEEQQLLKYFSLIASLYSRALENYAYKTQQKLDSKLLLQLIARTLHYLGKEIKWYLFCFKIPSTHIWQKINQTYHLAETLNLTEKAVFTFKQNKKATTAQDLFLVAHLQGTLRHGLLNALEIEQAYKILYAFSNQIHIHTAPTANTTFMVSLDSNDPASYYQNAPVSPMQRFWSMQTIESIINQWRATLIAGYPLSDLEIKELSLPTMNKLIQAWQQKRVYPARAERKPVNLETSCIIGLNAILKKLAIDGKIKPDIPTTTKANIEFTIGNHQTSYMQKQPIKDKKPSVLAEFPCTILNNGRTGVALTLPLNKEIELGSLILWYAPDTSISSIGIIKRLCHQEKRRLLVGVELICNNPLLTKIYPLQQTKGASLNPKLGLQGLLCQMQQKKQKKYILLTDQAHYKQDIIWQLTLQNLIFEFKIKNIIQYGSNWYAYEIQILEQDS